MSQPIPIGSNNASSGQSVAGSAPFSGTGVGLSTSSPFPSAGGGGSSIFGKWGFSPLKSTTAANPAPGDSPPGQAHNLPIPAPPGPPADVFDRDEHDSLEFGDLGDLRTRGWAAAAAARGQRRAVSMSVSPGTSLLGSNQPQPMTGAMNDKMARGNGVLRRLSLSGGFATRPAPPAAVPGPPNSTPIGSFPHQEPTLAAHPPAQTHDDAGHRGSVAGHGHRRFSESTRRRRGVSPTGERLLRDQVHF